MFKDYRSMVLVVVIISAVTSVIHVAFPNAYDVLKRQTIETVRLQVSSKHHKFVSKKYEKKSELFNLMEENNFHLDPTTNCTLDYANSKKLPQDHPCVIELVRKLLKEPSARNTVYKFKYPKQDLQKTSAGQLTAVTRLLNNQTEGFFVECGAADGESYSNTLFLEDQLKWSGLLIEADPAFFDDITKVNRKSWKINTCISIKKYPTTVTFRPASLSGKIDEEENKEDDDHLKPSEKFVRAQCFPFYSYMLALGRTSIDYFSLDIEGLELAVLRTIPWHKVDIKVLTVEFTFVKEGQRAMIDFMKRNGFIYFGNIYTKGAQDNVFVKDFLKDLRPEYEIFYPNDDSPYAEERPVLWKNDT